ncbi:hypothetical protein [Rhizobium leguminosarum]|uniref:hypothetical protein n=1 Tax=Rhizobium leguminosarum TaxID=384 RepID=UPI0010319303|nr:hypothetical protein [Rhizobium leguminosarum]TAV81574.1 hypothetical protein ELI22_34030 [Rhizobium leguminosarum]TAV94180.1 hypothetical protein ELI21_10425 [Rhizobium leguminosarum]TAW35255.1 hypothetical protein ELI23_10465 [Rhizobium leguminosarum]
MFEVDPSQIEALGSYNLVALLRRLLHAEALAADIPLSGISVPLQITVPDGGEDGRITWENGRDSTYFLPVRRNFFQCKASKIGRAGWKKECWSKETQRAGKARLLNTAIERVIAEGGSYVGFTTEALTGPKRDQYIAAIGEGIREAGVDPTKLAAIDIYDANKIAEWAAHHPSVAIWLAEKSYAVTLAGYKTVDGWGATAEFQQSDYVEDRDPRFEIGQHAEMDETGASNRTSGGVAWARILGYFATPRKVVRVVGSAGVGKSRFVYESLKVSGSQIGEIFKNNAIIADYKVVASKLLETASRLAERGARALLVVDDCPRPVAMELAKIATQVGSELRVITIDTDGQPFNEGAAAYIAVRASGGELVERIIRNRHPKLSASTLGRLSEACSGNPRFAVLAAGKASMRASDFETAGDVFERVLEGAAVKSEAQILALQCLAMFEKVAIEGDGRSPAQLDEVATGLARMSGDEMYEHLAKARAQYLVEMKGEYLGVHPPPLAIYLALRRLELIRPSLLERFISTASDALALSMLRRWRDLDKSVVVIEAAKKLLYHGESFQTPQEILSARGAAMIDALVHVVPDEVSHLLRVMVLPAASEGTSLDGRGRQTLVQALTKLAFRSRSFMTAARLLMYLAAYETEDWANNSTGIFKQLFQLELSGTEVPPSDRFVVMDEGLASDDPRVRAACVEALASVFQVYVTRFGDAEQIGSDEPLTDWRPDTWSDVYDFYRGSFTRLAKIAASQGKLSERSEAILAQATRVVLSSGLYEEFGSLLVDISDEKGGWPEAVKGVGDWLFFDRKKVAAEHADFVRHLYDRLFPQDTVQRAILFTKFWQSDIRDPDVPYSEGNNDFAYSERKARALAAEIASDRDLTLETVRTLTRLSLNNVYLFAEELAGGTTIRREVFNAALEVAAGTDTSVPMLRGLLRGIDKHDPELADECVRNASAAFGESRPIIDFYSALALDVTRLDAIIEHLRHGRIPPEHCIFLSYGRGLDDLAPQDVGRLLDVMSSISSNGAWAALEIAVMYRHGSPFPREHAETVARLLVEPKLTVPNTGRQREAHLYEELVGKVRKAIGINIDLAHGLSRQVVTLAKSEDYQLFSTLDDALRIVVGLLREDAPDIIWEYIAKFFETATPIERNRMKRVIGPNADRFDNTAHTEAGPLFGLPPAMLYAWADFAEERPPALLDFYPLLSEHKGNDWHPSLKEIAGKYGASKTFREALARRLRPSSWSGSIVPLLEVYLRPLKSWFDHPIRALAVWAKEQHGQLERRIEIERERAER